jgi:uncharacterized low-complexity protein
MSFQHIYLIEDTDDSYLTETDLSVTNGEPDSPKPEEGKPGEPKAKERKSGEPKAEELKPGEPKAEERKPGKPKAEERKPGEPNAEERRPGEPKAEEPDTNEAQRDLNAPQPDAPQQEEPTPGTSSDYSNLRISSSLVAKIILKWAKQTLYV